MHELTSTRHNPMIDPNLHIWGWEIAFYLFLGGLVAGIMIIMGYFLFMKREKETDSCFKVLPYVGILALSVCMFVLFLDL